MIEAIKSTFVTFTPPYQKNLEIRSVTQANTTCCGYSPTKVRGGDQFIIRVGNCISLLSKGMHVMITIGNNFENYKDKETTDLANCPKINTAAVNNHTLFDSNININLV